MLRRRRITMQAPPKRERIVLDGLLDERIVLLADAALIGECKHRLYARRCVAGEQRDGAGRGDGGEAAIAQTVFGDQSARLFVQ